MDADTANLRMKWIMAIESFVLDFQPESLSSQSASDLNRALAWGDAGTRSGNGTGEDLEDDEDEGPMFAALSTQKLSPAEIEIMRTINKFTGCWMTDDEISYNKIVTEGLLFCLFICVYVLVCVFFLFVFMQIVCYLFSFCMISL